MWRVSWAPCRPSAMTVRSAPNPSTTRSARCRPPRRSPPPRRQSRRLSRRLDRYVGQTIGLCRLSIEDATDHKRRWSVPLHLSRRRQGAIDTFNGGVLRLPEALRFHLLQVGMGIAEARPDVFLVAEQTFFFGARAHIQNVYLAAAAEHALEPATQLAGIDWTATFREVGQHGRIAVEAVGRNGNDVVVGAELQVMGQTDGAQHVADSGDAEQAFERSQLPWRQPEERLDRKS